MSTRKHRKRDVIEAHRTIDEKTMSIFLDLLGTDRDKATRLDGHRHAAEAMTKVAKALQKRHALEVARDIGFHVADWNSDVAFVVALHLFPERFTNEEVAAGVTNLLIHAPNHLAAAAKLAGYPIEDIFGVDALRGNPEEDGE